MATKKETYKYNGMGLFDTLGMIFIVLKCTNLIDWGWMAVLSPLFISIVLGLFVALIHAQAGEK